MTKKNSPTLWLLGLGFVAVLGVVFWMFARSKPSPVSAAPTEHAVAQQPASVPAESPREESASTEASPAVAAAPAQPVPAIAAIQSAPSPASIVAGAAAAQPSVAPIAPIPPATPAVSTAPPSEIAATANMYAAHATLRTPEVADPDSKSNRQILQSMVTKAFAQPATPPPAPAKS